MTFSQPSCVQDFLEHLTDGCRQGSNVIYAEAVTNMYPRLNIKEGSNLGGCGTRTLARLLLGAVCVSLVTEAGVGARQVLTACVPTGV